jgi:uncharacterized protein with HEPN domain
MLLAGTRISDYLGVADIDQFKCHPLLQDAVIRNFEVLGDAARNILRYSPDFVAEHKHVPFRVLNDMRNQLIHAYNVVNLDVVWRAAREHVPPLISDLRKLIDALRT